MGIAVLGPLAVDGEAGTLRHHDRVVLTVLAMRPGETVSAERLADALWSDAVPETWAKIVQGCVVRLRKALGPDAIETTPNGYRLTVAADEIDSLRFEHLVGRGRELLALSEPDRAGFALDNAMALWRGEPLADLDGWEGSRAETTRLEELRRSAEELRIDAAMRAGHAAHVLADAQRLVDESPLRERRWTLLALAQYQTGQQAQSLRTLREVRTVLGSELGIDPGPELVALEQAILRQDPTLAATFAPADPSPGCPYRGLVPFGVSDEDTFFGREQDLERFLHHLDTVGVLAVVGASGSGKSSLVRAGVAAALARRGTKVRVVTPGAHPLDVLDTPPGPGRQPVLVVDQCEEVVTLCESATERSDFFDRLAARADEAPLVLAIRADQVGPMSTHPAFARLLQRGFQLLGPMGAEQLRACIERPAEQAGLLIEPGLTELLLRDLEDEPGALPLLSHALRETWTQREGRTLTVAGYRNSGGIRGAVARTADEVHDQLPAEDRGLLRDLMMRLVTSAPDGQLVRTRVPRRLLTVDGGVDARTVIVERLVTARLLVSDGEEIELAHEALIRAWPRLRQWLTDDADGHRIRQHLSAAAKAWDGMGRPTSELYRGVRLAQAVDWRQQSAPDLTPVEQDFLAASQALVDKDLAEARRRAETERAGRQRTRRLAVGLAAVLALALVAAGSATWFQQEASERADEADANRLAALSTSVGALDLQLLLAAQALRTADTPATRDGLLTGLLENRRADHVLHIGTVVQSSALANRGRTLFASANSQLFAWEPGSSRPPEVILTWGNKVAFAGAPTDDLAAVARWKDDDTPAIGVFDSEGRERFLLDGLDEVGGSPHDLGFSADSRHLYVVVQNERTARPQGVYLREYDLGTGALRRDELILRQDGRGPPLISSVGRDGAWTVSWNAGQPRKAVLVQNSTGRRSSLSISRRAAEPEWFTPLPTGTALAWSDGAVSLYDGRGRETQVLEFKRVRLDDVVVSPDGSWAATGDSTGVVTVWDIDERSGDWSPRETLPGLEGHLGLAVATDSATLVSVGRDGTVVVWDMSADAGLGTRSPGLGPNQWTSNTPADVVPGRLLVAPTRNSPSDAPWWERQEVSATFLDPRTGEVVDQVPVGPSAGAFFGSSVSVSPDRTLVAVTHQVGTVVLDADTREEVARITLDDVVTFGEPLPENVWCTAWTPDGGKLLLCAEGEEFDAEDGNLVVVDTDSWEVEADRIDVGGAVQSAELSPGGDLLALGMTLQFVDDAPPGLVKLLDTRTLEVVGEVDLGADQFPFDVSFSPDGRRLAVGVENGLVFVADVETGKLLHDPARAHSDSVLQVGWLPDNRTVVSTGFDRNVTLYDADRGLLRATMPVVLDDTDGGHTYLRAAGLDEVSVLTRQQPGRTYPLDPQVWLDRACAVVGRDLTRDEWSSYLPGRAYEPTCSNRS